MIPKKEILELLKKENKKLSKEGLVKIKEILKEQLKIILKNSSINADINARKIIKKEDITNPFLEKGFI